MDHSLSQYFHLYNFLEGQFMFFFVSFLSLRIHLPIYLPIYINSPRVLEFTSFVKKLPQIFLCTFNATKTIAEVKNSITYTNRKFVFLLQNIAFGYLVRTMALND